MKWFALIRCCFLCLLASCSTGATTELSASFTYSPASPVVGQTVQFTDTSTGSPTSWNWAFGDGAADTEENPSHTYTSAASYTVTLTVGNSAGSDSTTRSVVVLPGTPPTTSFPLKVSSNSRYLVTQSDEPFLMVADSPQGGMVCLSVSDASYYFANRASYGFNTAWINLVGGTTFGGRSNFSTYDGIVPFTTAGDYSTPNAAYFARVDAILNAAEANGITVWLDPAECIDSMSNMRANGVTKCTNFGRYLGNRYKNFKNIIWACGNDFQTWSDPADDAVVLAIANGIKATDTNHLHTVMLDYSISSSTDDVRWNSVIDINSAYTYYPTYAEVVTDYNLSPARPVVMCESDYEFERGSDAERLRRMAYWTYLAGGCGYIYGSGYVWPFASGWKTNLDTVGAIELRYCKNLLSSKAWYSLVPDQAHTLATSGYGTFSAGGTEHTSISANDYVTAALTPEGTLALVYVPSARTITVDMTEFSGSVIARWYDPTAGTYQSIVGSPFPNAGFHVFSTPGTHSDGASDWVLVLEKQ